MAASYQLTISNGFIWATNDVTNTLYKIVPTGTMSIAATITTTASGYQFRKPGVRDATGSNTVNITNDDNQIAVAVGNEANPITVNLPETPAFTGQTHTIKDASGENVPNITLDPGDATIDDDNYYRISTMRGSVTVRWDGTGWRVI